MKKIEYNKKIENCEGLNIYYNSDVLKLISFNEKLFNEFIEDGVDIYIPFFIDRNNSRIYNKTYYYLSQTPLIEVKRCSDLLPIFITNKNVDFESLKDFKYYALNELIKNNKVKFIPKILGDVEIDWNSQLKERKTELEKI